MLNEDFLTQDVDILPDANPVENNNTDILPEAEKENEKEPGKENSTADKAEDNTEKAKEESDEKELAAKAIEQSGGLDSDIEALLKDVEDTSEKVEAGIESAKDKVEEIQADPNNPNSDSLLKEVYQDLLTTETALQAAEIAKEVAMSKVSELQAQVSELEMNATGNFQSDNPDITIVNKLFTAAENGNEGAREKIKEALNKIHLSIFNSTIEEGQVNDNLSDANASGVSLNEGTLPVGEVPKPKKETDVNDITSILG